MPYTQPLHKHTHTIETAHPLEQRFSRRRFLECLVLVVITAGCASTPQPNTVSGPRATASNVSSPTPSFQRAALQPIRADNVQRVKSLATLDVGGQLALAVAWSPSGNMLAVGGTSGAVQLWDIATLKNKMVLQGHSDQVNRIHWSPDGRLLATASSDGTVRLWDGQRYTLWAVLQGSADKPALSISWSPDSKRLAVGYGEGSVEVWNVDTRQGQILLGPQSANIRTKAVWGIAWSPDGRWIISPQYDGIIHVWEAGSGKLVRTLPPDDLPNDVRWSPDGHTLASSSDKGTVQLWQPGTFKNTATLADNGGNGWVYPLAWSPDNRLLVGGYATGQVLIWDVDTKKALNAWTDHTRQVWDVAWSPDERLIASASKDGTVRLWGL